jgi:putative protein-disulfide isomerase
VPITVLYFARSVSVLVRYITDPACPRSWATEPAIRRLQADFGDELSWTYVMGGLAREIQGTGAVYSRLIVDWLDLAAESGMPFDPRIWTGGPIRSTHPACMAVKAAAEQASDGGYAYLRALREGLICFRRKLDTTEALVEEARRVRLDVERFRIDLGSHAIVEAFGADLEEARDAALPSLVFVGEDGARHAVHEHQPYAAYREAAEAAGAKAPDGDHPGVIDALRRFGRMATREVEEVCGLPGPRVRAELWRLASEWQVKPERVLTGFLWELA